MIYDKDTDQLLYEEREVQESLDTYAEGIFLDLLSGISDLADVKLNIRYPNIYDFLLQLGSQYNVDITTIEDEV